MYGVINQTVQSFVVDRLGPDAWERVAAYAGFSETCFVGVSPYPDALTLALIDGAAVELGVERDEALEGVGTHFVAIADQVGFGPYLTFYGDDWRSCVRGLDDLHARLSLTFEGFRPPHFVVEISDDGVVRLSYYSTRTGLAPLVKGILRGLGVWFGKPLSVEQLSFRSAGDDCDVFLVNEAVQT